MKGMKQTETVEIQKQQLKKQKNHYYDLINKWEEELSIEEINSFKGFKVNHATLKSMELQLRVLNVCIERISIGKKLSIEELKQHLVVDIDSDDEMTTTSNQETTDGEPVIKKIKLVNKAKGMYQFGYI